MRRGTDTQTDTHMRVISRRLRLTRNVTISRRASQMLADISRSALYAFGVVICLERGANDLHMVQLMPLPAHYLLLH